MKKLIQCFALSALASFTLAAVSCGSDKKEKKEVSDEPQLEARTADVQVYAATPIKGDDAEYFSIVDDEGNSVIKLNGIIEKGDYSTDCIVKATLDIKLVKKYPSKIHGFDAYSPLEMVLLNEDKEEIETLTLSEPDRDALLAELAKPNPGTLNVSYKGKVYKDKYNKVFDTVKYFYLKDSKIESEDEYNKRYNTSSSTSDDSSSSSSSVSSGSSSSSYSGSYDDDDDDDDGDDTESKMDRLKEKAKDLGSKAKDKAKELGSKAKEKADELKDKAKEFFNDLTD